jgi:hypothetical protein
LRDQRSIQLHGLLGKTKRRRCQRSKSVERRQTDDLYREVLKNNNIPPKKMILNILRIFFV